MPTSCPQSSGNLYQSINGYEKGELLCYNINGKEDKCQKESNIIEAQGKGDWSERQEVDMSGMDSRSLGYTIEMLFVYPYDEGNSLIN